MQSQESGAEGLPDNLPRFHACHQTFKNKVDCGWDVYLYKFAKITVVDK